MKRRVWLQTASLLLAWPGVALAGSYLDRAAIVLQVARQEWDWLRKHPHDRELARIMQRSAEARLAAVREALVPSEVALAHPHLLLLLEHYERSLHAATEREFKAFYRLGKKARDEEDLFRAVLERLGYRLPQPRSGG